MEGDGIALDMRNTLGHPNWMAAARDKTYCGGHKTCNKLWVDEVEKNNGNDFIKNKEGCGEGRSAFFLRLVSFILQPFYLKRWHSALYYSGNLAYRFGQVLRMTNTGEKKLR